MTTEIFIGLILNFVFYVLPIILTFYCLYILRYCVYEKGKYEVKRTYPLYTYLFIFICGFLPAINILTVILLFDYFSFASEHDFQIKHKSYNFLFKRF